MSRAKFIKRKLFKGEVSRYFQFVLDDATFTAHMAKRAGQGPFAAAPIVQGDYDGSGIGDLLIFPRGDVIGNATQFQYANFDPYQGSYVFWVTPEWDGDDGLVHYILYPGDGNRFNVYKSAGDDLILLDPNGGAAVQVDISAWTAGTTYCVVCRWDTLNSLDGTNYYCISINDAHSFDEVNQNDIDDGDVADNIRIGGGVAAANSGDSIIEGLTIYRRPLFDGTYGVRPMNGNQYSNDEIANIYAAGAGRDPTLVTGSEDVCFCLPTNSTEEILATGTGEAWSWPWGDNLLDVPGMYDGGLPGTDYAVEFNATTTVINCGSDADIDDIHDGILCAEAWVRADGLGEGNESVVLRKGVGLTTGGWAITLSSTGFDGFIDCATTDSVVSKAFTPDGKFHHVVLCWNDAGGADRKAYIAVDGVWAAAGTLGVDAIVTDASDNLYIGNDSTGGATFDGAIAWAAISNNARYTAGTNFVPPRAVPADDANYLASWPMDEGSGATIDNIGNQGGAGSGAANRDGTLADGSWSSIWAIDDTPVVPQSIQFYADEGDGIDFGSGANIDDLPSADCTIEFWLKAEEGTTNGEVISKTNAGRSIGWSFFVSDPYLYFRIFYDDTDIVLSVRKTDLLKNWRNGVWHHIAVDFDVGTLTARIFLDGVFDSTGTAVGNYDADAGEDLIVHGRDAIGTADEADGLSFGWIRLSNNRRYTGNNFVPAPRTNPPANDANAQLLINMTDGAGTTATDTSGNSYDGTITFGTNTRWNNTPDMEIDEPGAAIFGPKGYNVGSDAANDGVFEEVTVVAETDYVVFPNISIGESGRARPVIRIYDVSNAATVSTFKGPELHGVDAGAGNAAVLTVATARFVADALIGGTVYNITDGSSGAITDNSETVVTATLSGGTDDDWDIGDEYVIRFPYGYCERPWMESFCFQTPAGCTLLRVFVENESGEGVMQVHQVQVMPNLIVNGDHESLTGANPDIITGWSNVLLDAGDTESSAGSAAIIHAGAEAMEWNAGAIWGEYMQYQITLAINKFFAFGGWYYGDGTTALRQITSNALLHSSATENTQTAPLAAIWASLSSANRATVANPTIIINPNSGTPGGDRFSDDVHAVALDDVSITATAAIEANSLEGDGIRVDGRDTLTQPVQYLGASRGEIRCSATPRHETALAASFGQTTEYVFDCYEDANNYIRLTRTANTVTLAYNAQGAGEVTGNWDSTGVWDEDVGLKIRVTYGAFGAHLYTDGVLRVDLAGPCVFATDFTVAVNFGHRQDGTLQLDGVIS